MPWIALECPSCGDGLEWETENWRDEQDGDVLEIGVVCKACGAEVQVTYEAVETEIRVTPEGRVV